MRKKKRMQEMSVDELMEWARHLEEQRERRNARRRKRREFLKTAPREETTLRYRAEEKPCSVTQYLQVECLVLRSLDEFPDLKGDAIAVLLTLAHNILHLLHPGEPCQGPRLLDCPAFSLHELCAYRLKTSSTHFCSQPWPMRPLVRSSWPFTPDQSRALVFQHSGLL